jgi:hypothetical protein
VKIKRLIEVRWCSLLTIDPLWPDGRVAVMFAVPCLSSPASAQRH